MNSDVPAEEVVQPHLVILRNWLIFGVLLTFLAWYARPPLDIVGGLFHLADSPQPYFIPRLALLLNLVAPLSAVVVCLFLLLPGMTLALVASRGQGLVHFALTGFALSIVLICGGAILFHRYFGVILRGDEFFLLVAGLSLFAMIYVRFRARSGDHLYTPTPGAIGDAGWSVFLGFAMLALLSPKFFWQDVGVAELNYLASVELFIRTDWPFQPIAAMQESVPGLTSFLFLLPGSWFQRMFGETDLATRLPLLIYIPLLYIVVTGFIRLERDMVIRWIDHLLISAALLLFVLTMHFGTGQQAGTAMPVIRETLAVTLLLGFTYFVAANRMAPALWLGILAFVCLPTAGLWMVLTLVAFMLTWFPLDWLRLAKLFGVLAICALIWVVAPVGIRALGMPLPSGELDPMRILDQLRLVSIAEPQLWYYLVVPVGILPALSMLIWWRQDPVSRLLVVITMVFFLFYYYQAGRVTPHHLIPAIIPPLVILWRYHGLQSVQFLVPSRLLIVLGIVMAGMMVQPQAAAIQTFARDLGQQIALRGPLFDGDVSPAGENTFQVVFGTLFAENETENAPSWTDRTDPAVLLQYATWPKPEDQSVAYLLQPDTTAPPEAARVAGTDRGHTLYVLDEEANESILASYAAPVRRAQGLDLPTADFFDEVIRAVARFTERVLDFFGA